MGPAGVPVSIVIVTLDEGDLLRRTVDSMRATVPPSTEIVVVDDGSTDGSTDFLAGRDDVRLERPGNRLGISAGRNHGARASCGDIVVFSDAHVEADPGWLGPLTDALADPSVGEVAPGVGHLTDGPDSAAVGYGFTWRDISMQMQWLRTSGPEPAEVPFICGCFLAMRRDVFDEVGGFDEGMYRWGSEDAELSLRLWLLGYRCEAVPMSTIRHLFREVFPYQVEDSGVLRNILRLSVLHLGAEGIDRVVRHHAGRAVFPAAWARLLDTDTWHLRRELDTRRVRDVRWFARRFGIDAIA